MQQAPRPWLITTATANASGKDSNFSANPRKIYPLENMDWVKHYIKWMSGPDMIVINRILEIAKDFRGREKITILE